MGNFIIYNIPKVFICNIPKVFIYFLIFFFFEVKAQDFINYKNIESFGIIPIDLLNHSPGSSLDSQITKITNKSVFYKRAGKQFQHNHFFPIRDFFLNGKVLSNDPIGVYVNQVLELLLVHQPQLRKKVKVYIFKSHIPNSFISDEGIIFISLGLLARLETEAQLAFILAHEIAHFSNKDVLIYGQKKKIDIKEQIEFFSKDIELLLFEKSNYSKDQDIKADSVGLKWIEKASYNKMASIQALEILKLNLPFKPVVNTNEEIFSFNTSVQIPYKPLPIGTNQVNEIIEDSNLIHPNLNERIKFVNKEINASASSPLGKDFLLPDIRLIQIRKIARFELAKLFLQKGMIVQSLYTSYQLMAEEPQSIYLKDIFCKSLYVFAKTDAVNNRFIKNDNLPQKINFFYDFLKGLSPSEKNALAIMSYFSFHPNKEDLRQEVRFESLLRDFQTKFVNDTSSYFTQVKKYIHQDSIVNKIIYSITTQDEKAGVEIIKENKQIELNDSNLVLIDPIYKRNDLRKEKMVRYIASEELLMEYYSQIKRISREFSLNTSIACSIKMEDNGTKKAKEIVILKSYLEEVMENGGEVISSDYEKVLSICMKNNTSKIGFIGISTFDLKKSLFSKIAFIIPTAIAFPFLPLGIHYASVPKYRTYFLLFVIDVKAQRILVKDIKNTKFRDSEGLINSVIYYQFLKMVGKK